LASRLRMRLGVEVALAELFAQPSLGGFAQRVAAAGASTLPALTAAARTEPLPLSFAQQRLWFLAQLDARAGAAYVIPGGVRLSGALDIPALQAALDRIVARHEALRTVFVTLDGSPVQRIAAPDVGFALEVLDLSGDPRAEFQLERMAAEEASAPFDLAHGPLIRGRLLRLAPDEHALLVTMHHIVSDGWSMGVLINEFSALYAAFAHGQADPLPALAVQYADYAVWQRRWIAGDVLQRQLDFWRAHLSGAPALLELPTDRPRPALQDFAGASLGFELDAALSAALKDLSRRHGTTLFMTLLAAWATLLARLSGQHAVVIGTPVANRTRAEVEPLIGFFVNTLALRVDLSANPSMADLLAQVRASTLAAQAHQDIPFEQVVEALNPPRSLAHSPVFQVMFAWQNAPEGALELPGLQLQAVESGSGSGSDSVKFDLELSMHEAGDCIVGSFGYASALFDAATIARQLGHWQTLLRALVAQEARPVHQLPLLSGPERDQLLHGFNATDAAFPAERCIHELFEAQAARSPQATALVFEDTSLSYAELNARANRLAHHLVALGVRPDTRVAICVERSVPMVVGLLAILKAGGAYVPLDPDYPAERLAFMLADCAPRVLFTTASVRANLGALPASLAVLELDSPLQAWDSLSGTNPDASALGLSPSHLAYVIYTSGSTGRPKGVMVAHASLVNYLYWAVSAYAPAQGAVVSSSLSFDATITSLYAPLLCGSTVTLLREHREIDGLQSLLSDARGAGLVKITPAHLDAMGRHMRSRKLPCSAQTFVIGGEALSLSTVQLWHEHAPRIRLVNEYGPTETVVGCAVYEIAPGVPVQGRLPIGQPIANTRIYILDGHGAPVPIGVAGEIHIGGVQV
ncbi:MAG: hypothetical protein RL033_1467, partial [Pseudomonadota bacterium]